MGASKELVSSPQMLNIVMLGSSQKTVFFKKLCSSADKYEKHVMYDDLHFLSVKHNNIEQLIQLEDPGMSHTGARDMAIRRADLALLFFSSLSTASFQQLHALQPEFNERKNMPIYLICDTDEIIEEDEDRQSQSTGGSSTSEGYDSDVEHETLRRRNSMDKIRRAHEEGAISEAQISDFSAALGPHCRVFTISATSFDDGRGMLESAVRDMTMKRRKTRGILPLLQKTPSSEKREEKKEEKRRSSLKSPLRSPKSQSIDEEKNERKKSQESKVCAIM